jgi:pyrroloquinoline-quinone synthase
MSFGRGDYAALAVHLVGRAAESDSDHVRWLNQNVTRKRTEASELMPKLRSLFDLGTGSLKEWIIAKFVAKFYGKNPHPFVLALQHPTPGTLTGYVIEHQHFLRQWVRSCAFIMARTDRPEVILYELDNLNTEFGGFGPAHVAHYELLLRMGESLGLDRTTVLATPPLPATARGIEQWNEISMREHWTAAMAAMHGLELIANRDLVRQGATVRYFDPAILAGNEIPGAAKDFLREGYEADVGHSEQALDLVTRYANELDTVEEVQATFLRSIDLFDDYLIARLERGEQSES